jgi:VanZ family protein
MSPASTPRLRPLCRWLPRILAGTWISAFAATHIPPGSVPQAGPSDGALHAIGYAVLSLVLLLTLSSRGVRWLRAFLLAAGIIPLYAAFDELTQPLVGRVASLSDWAMDCLGLGLGTIVWLAIPSRRIRPASSPTS